MSNFLGPKPDPQHIQALVNCKLHNPVLVTLLQAKLDEVKTLLISADEDRVHRLQGKAQMLSDLLEALEIAPTILNRVSQPTR